MQLEKLQKLGNELVLTAMAFNKGISDFCQCENMADVTDKFDALTDLMSSHATIIEALITACPAALIEATSQGLSNLFGDLAGGSDEQ